MVRWLTRKKDKRKFPVDKSSKPQKFKARTPDEEPVPVEPVTLETNSLASDDTGKRILPYGFSYLDTGRRSSERVPTDAELDEGLLERDVFVRDKAGNLHISRRISEAWLNSVIATDKNEFSPEEREEYYAIRRALEKQEAERTPGERAYLVRLMRDIDRRAIEDDRRVSSDKKWEGLDAETKRKRLAEITRKNIEKYRGEHPRASGKGEGN